MFLQVTLALALLSLTNGHPNAAVPPVLSLTSRKISRKDIPALRRRSGIPPTNVPLFDYFNGTDLQWFGNVTVGTPPQDFTVVFDTGSFTFEIPSTACGESCATQRKFDPSKSSTFVAGNTTSTLIFGTGVGVDPVQGDNYEYFVVNATDTVSVAGFSVQDVEIFLITEQTPKFSPDPFDGIQGLSPGAQGLFAGLVDQGLQSLFSTYLTPLRIGHAELTLGGIDGSKSIGPLTFASITTNSHWQVPSQGITVNGKSSAILEEPRDLIFDSGTSNIVLLEDATEAAYALISPDIKPNPEEPNSYGIPCSKIHSLPAEISFASTSQDGKIFHLTIPSQELNVGPFRGNPALCQTLINSDPFFQIIGGSLLKYWYTVWDVGNQRMGFAPNKF